MINSFKDKYAFLSNFHPVEIVQNGSKYLSVEAAYQAQKCRNPQDIFQFQTMDAKTAKATGKKVKVRPNWESIKNGQNHLGKILMKVREECRT